MVQADVAKLPEIDKFFSAVSAKFGKIDVLFVNAGVATFAPFAGFTEKAYDELFDINAKGAFFTVQKALPHLNDGASVILNTSVAGHVGNPLGVAYGATKAAMRSFVRSMAADLAGRNIRVNAIAPGPIDTPIFDRVGLSAEQKTQVASGIHRARALETPRKTGRNCRRRGISRILGFFLHDRHRDQRWRRRGRNLIFRRDNRSGRAPPPGFLPFVLLGTLKARRKLVKSTAPSSLESRIFSQLAIRLHCLGSARHFFTQPCSRTPSSSIWRVQAPRMLERFK